MGTPWGRLRLYGYHIKEKERKKNEGSRLATDSKCSTTGREPAGGRHLLTESFIPRPYPSSYSLTNVGSLHHPPSHPLPNPPSSTSPSPSPRMKNPELVNGYLVSVSKGARWQGKGDGFLRGTVGGRGRGIKVGKGR